MGHTSAFVGLYVQELDFAMRVVRVPIKWRLTLWTRRQTIGHTTQWQTAQGHRVPLTDHLAMVPGRLYRVWVWGGGAAGGQYRGDSQATVNRIAWALSHLRMTLDSMTITII